MYDNDIPQRVRVLILGGGIHGVGVLHDLASRGWKDVHLVEKSTLGAGTSSASTKLIHGGLRYLRRIGDFGLVNEALEERKLLTLLAPDIVKPIEMVFPILKKGGMPAFMVKTGLWLYDFLAGKNNLQKHKTLTEQEARTKVPNLDVSKFTRYFSFFDCQTDDLALVNRVASSAVALGATVSEHCEATAIREFEDGYIVTLRRRDGSTVEVSAQYVVNALGPWANIFLERNGIKPTHRGVNNKGAHLVLPDIGMKAALFLQSRAGDGRIFFVVPWQGMTLLGTTESEYQNDPDLVTTTEEDVDYLLKSCNEYMMRPFRRQDILQVFAGLRWLAVEPGQSLTSTSRHFVIGQHEAPRGGMFTIYGGKLTTYRTLARTIGDEIVSRSADPKKSRTHEPSAWCAPGEGLSYVAPADRFTKYKVSNAG
jgi:glycerol-3-phosphate dehydrogenase